MVAKDAGSGGAFRDLSALLSCCGSVRFAGFGATLDGYTPLGVDPKGLEGDLQGVFEALLLSSLGAFAF